MSSELEKLTYTALLTAAIILLVPVLSAAQGLSLGENKHLVNVPTAGSLSKGSVSIEARMFPGGGVLTGVSVGLSDRINFGAHYGGMNIIGEGDVEWNPQPEVSVRYRLFEETFGGPAVSLGYSSQGFGPWNEDLKRYQIKSPGFFAVASKNYEWFGNMGFHAGGNYSFEIDDGDEDPNLFFGFDKSFNSEISLLVEYDFALNDNEDNALGSKKGYLNAAVRWIFVESLILELDVTNVLGNRADTASAARELKIIYFEYF